MKRSKSWRRWKEKCIIKKRLKLLKWLDFDRWFDRDSNARHRLSKKHPLDCGCSKCYSCHSEKLMNIENPRDVKRSKVKLEEDYQLINKEKLE